VSLRENEKQVAWLNADEAIFYGCVWCVGFLAALFVALDSPNIESVRKCCTVGGVSGFLAFSSVALFVGRITEPVTGHWYYLGLAALIGLSARQQEQIKSKLIELFFRVADDRNAPPKS
jgi:hypothetical protein